MYFYYTRFKGYSTHFPIRIVKVLMTLILIGLGSSVMLAQGVIKGKVVDGKTNNPLGQASVLVIGTQTGALTNDDGTFSIKSPKAAPVQILVRFVGYDSSVVDITSFDKSYDVRMQERTVEVAEVEIVASAYVERQKQSALSVESMSITAIKETPAANFYEGLGHLKGVDMNSASFGFKVVNTRGFNSTQPVRSLQLIDGVDNQSPGLNFSLGNFLGASELDLESVDLIVGASSAYYGPNAFNGVIAMKTKNPFIHRGLSASVKVGERNWVESAVRYAKVFKNKDGVEKFAAKFNIFYLRADDWEADNFEEAWRDLTVRGATPFAGEDNPGGYDAVNRYGDEVLGRATTNNSKLQAPGLGLYYRTGFNEADLLDYDTRNLKANVAFHYKLRPNTELIASSSYSNGTTVFQGVNRISLKDIQFFQHKVEIKNPEKFFVRAYVTHEDAGNSYDPVFTANRIQSLARSDGAWLQAYNEVWRRDYAPLVRQLEGYPSPPSFPDFLFDFEQQARVLEENKEQLAIWHNELRQRIDGTNGLLDPNSAAFQAAFDSITSRIITKEGGTKFFDRSALYHVHGEYKFNPSWADITIGANGRYYTPYTQGSIFADTGSVRLNNLEYGAYAGIKKNLASDRLILTGTLRMDKNQNFDLLFSPALTGLLKFDENNSLRVSLSSAIRNPTLADQFLAFDVGGAVLSGNLSGFTNLIELDSLRAWNELQDPDILVRFDLDPIQPEKVTTYEFGYRGLLGKRVYIDAGYYFSRYTDFIGFRLAFNGEIISGFPIGNVLRISANASDIVTTQGAALGFNYFISPKYTFGGNYSWNVLNTQSDDPIVPAYNTPEHKFNVNFGGRNVSIAGLDGFGFNVNYKWVEGFLFEGSPQFTGLVPTYDLLDAQISKELPKIHTTVKLGASNILNNEVFTVYGGPRIGRLAYLSLTYDFSKL
ncbi:MAG: TonB-dependent receptor [Bacteroidota bacterium]